MVSSFFAPVLIHIFFVDTLLVPSPQHRERLYLSLVDWLSSLIMGLSLDKLPYLFCWICSGCYSTFNGQRNASKHCARARGGRCRPLHRSVRLESRITCYQRSGPPSFSNMSRYRAHFLQTHDCYSAVTALFVILDRRMKLLMKKLWTPELKQ